jgi:hypothetical protein
MNPSTTSHTGKMNAHLSKTPSTRSLPSLHVSDDVKSSPRRGWSNSNSLGSHPLIGSGSTLYSSSQHSSDDLLTNRHHSMVPKFVSVSENPTAWMIGEVENADVSWGYFVNGDTTDKTMAWKRPNRIFEQLQRKSKAGSSLRKDWTTVPI